MKGSYAGDKEYIKFLQGNVKELRAQIEDMKCCGNCEHVVGSPHGLECSFSLDGDYFKGIECEKENLKHWKIRQQGVVSNE
ncbi:MAG: hypothetical protein DRP09_15885 [Candidatus Thorarchaeota archaeon]|nr:MAG: hypothetical protein DRP09_15885 [Candidatus Thorarchaeota archaeon]